MRSSTFGVIIPYFQRSKGVLSEALRSVARQDVKAPVKVVVVDDSSPVPAEEEIAGVELPEGFDVVIIRQPNAGPGVARNRGIEALASADYIAFLDSDDCWEPHHLSAALVAMEKGFDLYTAETEEGGSGFRYLESFFGDSFPLSPIDGVNSGYELLGPGINFSVKGPLATMSVLVVRSSLIGSTRFDSGLRTAGEDGLFCSALCAKRPRIFVSLNVDVKRGRGVNIFTEGDWGSRAATMRAIYFLRSRISMLPLVMEFPVARNTVKISIEKARIEVWRATLASMRRGNLPVKPLLSLFVLDPRLFFSLAAALRAAHSRGE